MEQSDRCGLLRPAGDMKNIPADDAERVGEYGDHMAVLLNVFGKRVSHQTPAADIAHPGQIGKKAFVHPRPPALFPSIDTGIISMFWKTVNSPLAKPCVL